MRERKKRKSLPLGRYKQRASLVKFSVNCFCWRPKVESFLFFSFHSFSFSLVCLKKLVLVLVSSGSGLVWCTKQVRNWASKWANERMNTCLRRRKRKEKLVEEREAKEDTEIAPSKTKLSLKRRNKKEEADWECEGLRRQHCSGYSCASNLVAPQTTENTAITITITFNSNH